MTEKKILVADDDADLLGMITFYLKKQGYIVVTANDGQEVLDIAYKERFDLIILDVMMPKMDGYHAAQELSEKLGANCPKIIIMTSRDIEKDKGVALASGACAIVQKPLKLVELRSRVKAALED